MKRTEFRRRIRTLIPDGADELDVVDRGIGLQDQPWRRLELRRWGPPYQPLDFQQEVIRGLQARIKESAQCVGLLSLPTGAGKTLTCAWTLLPEFEAQIQQSGSGVLLWLAPQRELLHQAAEAVAAAWWSGLGPDSLDIEVLGSSSDFRVADHPTAYFLTPQLLGNIGVDAFPMIRAAVFDEAHHAAAETFSTVWQDVKESEQCGIALGLSATPTRTDHSEIPQLLQAFDSTLFMPESLGSSPLVALVDKGVLSNPQVCQIPGVPQFSRGRGFDDPRTAQALIADPDRWEATVNCILRDCIGPTVVYAVDRFHGETLTRHLRALGCRAEYVDGRTGVRNRVGVFERFRSGQTKVLVNVALLIEGVDCPAAENVVLTYPVKSEILLKQMVGRVLRGKAVGGTSESYVWSSDAAEGTLDRMLYTSEYSYARWQVTWLS